MKKKKKKKKKKKEEQKKKKKNGNMRTLSIPLSMSEFLGLETPK